MTRYDIRAAIVAVAVTALVAPVMLHAQVAPSGSAAARAIALRTTSSAARTASALSSLGTNSAASGAARVTSVLGYVWAGEGTPISNATVQLRNIVTGQVEQVSTTLQNGAFSFTNVPGGTYAIEYVSDVAGKVATIGQAISVAPGETVATFVRLGSELTALVPQLASNAAQAVVQNVTQAVATGVVSVAGTATPEQPASPLK
jgi:hypothetical protein